MGWWREFPTRSELEFSRDSRPTGISSTISIKDSGKKSEMIEGNRVSSVITDTIPKRNRKEMLEREMDILDKDIKQIEAHPILYIS